MSDPTVQTVTWGDSARQAAFEHWLSGQRQTHRLVPQSLRPASADASFRRYLRIDDESGQSLIISAAMLTANLYELVQLPPVVSGVALLTAFGRRGPIGGPVYDLFGIQLPFSTAAVVLALAPAIARDGGSVEVRPLAGFGD